MNLKPSTLNLKRLLCFFILHFAFAAFAQFDMLCDSNGTMLPGFSVPYSNLVGSASQAQLPSNVVLTSTLNLSSNNIRTNLTALIATNSASISNLLWFLFPTTYLTTTGGTIPFGNQGCVPIGGFNNVLGLSIPAMDGDFILAGKTNLISGYSIGSGILGGVYDSVYHGTYCIVSAGFNNSVDTCESSGIFAGEYNFISASSDNCIIGGYGNWIVGGGAYNTIFAGSSNTIGQIYGHNNIFDGPYAPNYCAAGGVGAWPIYSSSFIWADNQGATNYFRNTTTNQFLVRAKNGVGINTNATGTNALNVLGNINATTISIGGVDIGTLFNPANYTNTLSTLWQSQLSSTGAVLQAQITANAAASTTASNVLQAQIIATNNILVTQIAATSNYFAGAGLPQKAFTATLPATYSSIGIGFNTPLMPDGNYSVALFPQDQNTAEAILHNMSVWVGSKTSSGFTIYAAYATNAYNLNFECIIHENTQ